MTKHADARRDFAELMRSASPDVAALNADIAAELANAGAIGCTVPMQRSRSGANVPSEHDEQVALFAWAEASQAQHPELMMLFAIPNGGDRYPATGAMLKCEGVKAGVPDVMLAVRRGHWGGLFVEMKRADHSNHATPEQQVWIERLRNAGYMAICAYGCTEAQQAIMAYLGQE